MKIVGYYLSRCCDLSTQGKSTPPKALNVNTWNDAYNLFFDVLGDGRTCVSFQRSLKNVRDGFDRFFENGRAGWTGKNQQNDPAYKQIFVEWENRSDEELQRFVFGLLLSNETDLSPKVLSNVEAKTEGGTKVYISQRLERDSRVRNKALALHGYDCMACSFNYEQVYGEIGKNFIEVHHVIPLSDAGIRETNPKTDLVVLCANCHRMVHRKKGVCLSIEELREHITIPNSFDDKRVGT
ncbi:MAG: HNH endonuclease [Rhodobacteraceae bacterium]|nr:HNH endonuclease [Paracoccaceae bacterium]